MNIEIPTILRSSFVEAMTKDIPEDVGEFTDRFNSQVHKSMNFLKKTSEALQSIETALKANQSDPTKTPQAANVDTFKFAQMKLDEIETNFEKAGDPEQLATKIESTIEEKIKDSATLNPLGREARENIKVMPQSERSRFVSKAINSGDRETAEFVLGAKPFMSGISETSFDTLRSQFNNKFHPNETKATEFLRKIGDRELRSYYLARETIQNMKTPDVSKALEKNEAATKAMKS